MNSDVMKILFCAKHENLVNGISSRLDIKIVSEVDKTIDKPVDENNAEVTWMLFYRDDQLHLSHTGDLRSSITVDFDRYFDVLSKTNGFSRKSLLGRATGAKPGESRKLIDATAGLGRDSLVLAALGFRVQAFERSPIIFELLKDGMRRANDQSEELTTLLTKIDFQCGDAIELMTARSVEVVYLDPMYPERRKSSLPKKEMQVLQRLLGKSTDVELMFESALVAATERVVIKRPLSVTPVKKGLVSSFSGKSVRFDLYIGNKD